MSILTLTNLASWRDYLELCKPRVVLLMLITAVVGMHLAAKTWVPWNALIAGTIGIGLCAASAAVINHVVDQHIDSVMARTQSRPIPNGRLTRRQALLFATIIGLAGLAILQIWVNQLTAVLTLLTQIGYAGIYTLYLKRATPQNIVIGGAAGAAPPLLGWTAVTGHIDPNSLLLVLIIFAWTPPHFWALAIHRQQDYAKADIPMLPVTHGIRFTKLSVLLYTLLMIAVSLLPFVTGMSGMFYLMSTLILDGIFLFYAIQLWLSNNNHIAMTIFKYSIYYLFLLFIVLLIDHYI